VKRRLVTLERRTQAADGSIGIAESFLEVQPAWAHVAGVSATMQVGMAQVEDGVTHRLVMRWVDPTTWTHLSIDGERYRVRGTRDPDTRRKWLEVMAEKLNAVAA
jgi:head-tail adaptor